MSKEPKFFDVTLYPIVTVRVAHVEARTMKEAIEKAEKIVDYNQLFNRDSPAPGVKWMEYADGTDGFLVDVEGDSQFNRTRFFTKNGNLMRFRRKKRANDAQN